MRREINEIDLHDDLAMNARLPMVSSVCTNGSSVVDIQHDVEGLVICSSVTRWGF